MNGFLTWISWLIGLVPGLGAAPPPVWNGYVEADYYYAAAPSGGTIETIAVAEGQLVRQGELLFVLDADQQQAQLSAAQARAEAAAAQVKAAEATLANLKTGARPEELQVTRASLTQAEANLALAQQVFTRTQGLFNNGNAPKSQLDQAQAGLDAARASVEQLQAQLAVAQLPAREDQIAAAQANVAAATASQAAAKADAETAAAAVADRSIAAPEAGRIETLFYKAGEVAGAGVPVTSIIGADAMKVLFYVSETDRQQFALGQQIAVVCDGCGTGLTATISHFASDPQFTPPIIYSRDERHRLVFQTEAILDQQDSVLPGQPVSIGRLP